MYQTRDWYSVLYRGWLTYLHSSDRHISRWLEQEYSLSKCEQEISDFMHDNDIQHKKLNALSRIKIRIIMNRYLQVSFTHK